MRRINLIIILHVLLLSGCAKSMSSLNDSRQEFTNIRKPAVAGTFYPDDAGRLDFKINKYLKAVPDRKTGGEIKAILAPHAGYDYSGQVAAHAYKLLAGKKIGTAVIICNSHTVYFSGAGIDDSDAWETPLGQVALNKELAGKLINYSPAISYNRQAHSSDHTLEVQLPFLQTVIKGDFKILPILFGNMDNGSYKELAAALKENLGADDIIVISSDMSHYPGYEDANRIDSETLAMIKTGDIGKLESHISAIKEKNILGQETALCGIDGVKTVLSLFDFSGSGNIEVLNYANSGDADNGDKSRVVGYGAVVFIQNQNANLKMQNDKESLKMNNILSNFQQKELLKIARETTESFVRTGTKLEFKIADERLNWKEGAFVTLHLNGELKGCIGQIVPDDKPLYEVVSDMAIAACSQDNRFDPVRAEELDKLDYEVSVLSIPQTIDNYQNIELGKHGVIVKKGARSGVFLPQVADETGWSLDEFLSELCYQKAGLPPDCYQDKETELLVFSAQVFSEKELK